MTRNDHQVLFVLFCFLFVWGFVWFFFRGNTLKTTKSACVSPKLSRPNHAPPQHASRAAGSVTSRRAFADGGGVGLLEFQLDGVLDYGDLCGGRLLQNVHQLLGFLEGEAK